MRLLVIPGSSTRVTVWKESDFIVWLQFIKEWKDTFVYVVINKDAEIPDEYKYPNVMYVYMKHWMPYVPNQASVCTELYDYFNPIDGKYQVDAILTSKSIIAAPLKRMFNVFPSISIPVYIVEGWVPRPSQGDLAIEKKLKVVSYSECMTFFPTAREKDFAMGYARRFLSASSVMECMKNAVVRSQGIPAKTVHSIALKTEKFEDFTLYFSARFNSNKRWQEIMSTYEDLFKMTGDVRIKALCPTITTAQKLEGFEKVELRPSLPYMEYLEFMCSCHASMAMSKDEGFSFGWTEQICTGNPVLLPRLDWAIELVDKKYPFLFNNKIEAIALLKWVKEHYEEARERMKPYTERTIVEHDISVAASDILSEINTKGTYMDFEKGKFRCEAALTAMKPRFTFKEFLKWLTEEGKLSIGTYVMFIGAFRNFYIWLCNHCDMEMSQEIVFRKR